MVGQNPRRSNSMIDHDDARTTVLGRIRAALTAEPPAPVVVPRDYDREPLSGSGDVTRFAPPGPAVVAPADLPTAWVEGVDALIDDAAEPWRSHDWIASPQSSPA